MKIIAIDPGSSGGIAWLDIDGNPQCAPMPATEGDVFDFLRGLAVNVGTGAVVIEDQVGCMGPGMKVSASAMFTFGRGFGFLLGTTQALGFRVELVRPQKWQKAMSLGSKKDAGGKTPWKNKLKAEAQRRFPYCSVTIKTADALLLLDYFRSYSSFHHLT